MARRQSRATAPIRYAVVGLGHIAQVAVLPAFAHARNSTLAALVSGDDEKRRVLGRRYDVSRTYSYDQLDRCLREVDAVYLCTPNSAHAALAVQAAGAGVHVLCEKPLAVTDDECTAMIDACRAADVRLMTAYRLHFDPITLAVLEHAHGGRLGELRYFAAAFSMRATPGGIRTRPETGGGVLYDLGIYCINAARMLFGTEPRRVSAHAVHGHRSGMPDVDETTAVALHFDGDRLATFTASFDAADVSTYRIVGTDGHIVVDPAFEYAEPLAYTMTVGERVTRRRGRKHDQFAAELVYFSRCVQRGDTPEPSGEEGAWDVRIIDAALESARRGEAIALRPFAEPGPRPEQATALPPVAKPRTINAPPPHD